MLSEITKIVVLGEMRRSSRNLDGLKMMELYVEGLPHLSCD